MGFAQLAVLIVQVSVVFVWLLSDSQPLACPVTLCTCAGHSTTAAQAALDAVSSNLPGGSNTCGVDLPAPPPPKYNDPATHASAQAAQHPGTLQPRPHHQRQQRQFPAGPAASTSAGNETVSGASDSAESGSGSGGGRSSGSAGGGASSSSVMSSADSDLASLQVLTELSVNIDAGQLCWG